MLTRRAHESLRLRPLPLTRFFDALPDAPPRRSPLLFHLLQRLPLRLCANVRIPRQHLRGNVACNLHDDGLISGTPVTPAFLRTLFQAVFSDPIGPLRSFGKRLPPGNTNHSGFTSPNCVVHRRRWSTSTSRIAHRRRVGPIPTSLFDLPGDRHECSKKRQSISPWTQSYPSQTFWDHNGIDGRH
jgi:hypothetical protein